MAYQWLPQLKILAFIPLLLYSVYFVSPLFDGTVFTPKTRVIVPDDYITADQITHNTNGRILHLPLAGHGVIYDWESGYQGGEPSAYLFEAPSLGRTISITYDTLPQKLLQLDQRPFSPEELTQTLNDLSVTYIVVHTDTTIAPRMTPEFYDTLTMLFSETNGVSLVNTFTHFDLYSYDGNGFVVDDNVPIGFTKFGNTEYRVPIVSQNEERVVELRESYHPLWTATLNDKDIKHIPVRDYANGYVIPESSSGELIVSFTPQRWLYASAFVSVISAIVLVIYFTYETRKSKKSAAD